MIRNIFKFSGGWTFEGENESEGVCSWSNEYGDILSVNFFPMIPDIGASLDDVDGIRSFYREMAKNNGIAPVEIEVEDLKSLASVKTIYKLKMDPSGFAYIGSYTIPFSDRSFVIKIQALESGITGMRESAVLILEDCKEVDEATGKLIGWESDPYDPTYKADFMANKADFKKYDEKFPEHPLSRVRFSLKDILDHTEVNKEMYSFQPFVFGKGPERSKWWKFWGKDA